jgi:hypothetical protein
MVAGHDVNDGATARMTGRRSPFTLRRMRILRTLSIGSLAFVVGATSLVAGCGSGGGPATANVQAGSLPDGESWQGVYFNQVFGYLHIMDQGDHFVGRWKRTDGGKWGEMSGTVTGNVVHFTWKEHTYGMTGPSATRGGKGYFVYKMGANNIAELKGEYGNGADETGAEWNLVKQKGMKADLDSIKGDVGATDVPAAEGGWDSK